VLASGKSFFWVGKWTSSDTAATQTWNPPLTVVSDLTNACYNNVGASGGVLRHVQYTGAWTATDRGSSLNDGNPRLVGWTHSTGGDLKAYVGTTQQGSTATGITYNTTYTGWSAVGGGVIDGSNAADGFVGDLGAVVIVSGVVSGTDLAKLYTWARAEFGAQ
jgi:hypothetical protein